MISPEQMTEWLGKFRADHGLEDLVLGDADLAEERAEFAAGYVAENLPARYADALPQTSQVCDWVAAVVREAAAMSEGNGQRVATIHQGPSLLLLGPTGVGKTHDAFGAVRVVSALGLHARWVVISAADLYARLRPRHGIDSEAEFAAVAGAPLLVVDDLGAAKNSEWVEEVNFRLVNARYEAVKPTLFTSNVPPKALATALGDRVASRLVEMTTRVVIDGADRRRAA